MKPPIPCKDCILMAICNAKMHEPEKTNGSNVFDLRNECVILSNYLEKYHSTVIDETTIRTSLALVYKFFMNGYKKSFYFSDNKRKTMI